MYDREDQAVNDHGFRYRVNWPSSSYPNAPSMVQKKHHHHHRRHSDEVANGDPTDDKEVEDVKDVNDDIVDDHGFRYRTNWPKASLSQRRHRSLPRPPT